MLNLKPNKGVENEAFGSMDVPSSPHGWIYGIVRLTLIANAPPPNHDSRGTIYTHLSFLSIANLTFTLAQDQGNDRP